LGVVKRSVPIAAVLVAAALVALLVYGVAARTDNTTLDSAVQRGAHPLAPDHRLPVLGGSGDRSLADYRGKVVVLNFWASWCVPCTHEAPILERAQRHLQQTGTGTVLGVTYKDFTGESLKFMRDLKLTYPSLRDDQLQLAPKYGTHNLPETFVIDGQGRIVALSRGEVTEKFLTQAIATAQTS
jgi:cytochrome c biogenesis protein CcmG, thiol:disulfide interchange protein DsbE